jgi:hypothetical protein
LDFTINEIKMIVFFLKVKLARLRKPKITCSPSYEDYRLKINAITLLDMGHILRRSYTGRIGKERNLNLECG